MEAKEEEIYLIELISLSGDLVYKDIVDSLGKLNVSDLPSNLPDEAYLVRITKDENKTHYRLNLCSN